MELLEAYYSDNFKTFDEWFNLVKENQVVYPNIRIPYQKWLDEYIDNIESKREEEVLELLRYMLCPFTRKLDISNCKCYDKFFHESKKDNLSEKEKESYKKFCDNFIKIEKNLRILSGQEAWEELTWILQLLPCHPYKAIKALNSYLDAEILYMPDDRILGINQCISIIEAKFIYTNNGLENNILNLQPREFELLIGSLYNDLGYETKVTPSTRDGGKDIVARINREDGSEVVYVECKLYKTTELTSDKVRALLGTIYKDNINRGVIFCTGYVNENLKEIDPRIQIWALEDIIVLLNAHLGSNWYKRMHILIENQNNR